MPDYRMARTGYAMPTEGAVVYGDMPALSNAAAGIENVVAARQQSQLRQQQEAAKLAQSWRDNELQAAEGQLWGNQLGQVEAEHVSKGQQLMQQGIDPYNSLNPKAEEYRRERRDIIARRAYRKGIEDQYIKAVAEIRKNPDKYDQESVKQLNDFIANTNLNEAYSTNAQLPGLQERFDITSALQGYRAPLDVQTFTEGNRKITDRSVNRPETERAILARISSSPGGMRTLERITEGLPVQDVLNTPDTIEETVTFYDTMYDGDPQFRSALAAQGIASKDDPRYQQVVQNAAQRRVQAKKALRQQMDNWVSMSSSGLQLGRSEVFDDSQERLNIARQQLALSQRREARLAADANGAGTKDVTFVGAESIPIGQQGTETNPGNAGRTPVRNAVNFYNTTVSVTGGDAYNMNSRKPYPETPSISGKIVKLGEYPFDRTTGELLDESQVANNPNVEYRKMAQIEDDGANILVPATKVPSTLPTSKQKMVNSFLQSDTDQRPATGSKTATRSQIQGLVGQPGYEGYSEQELIDYYRSQGYTIN